MGVFMCLPSYCTFCYYLIALSPFLSYSSTRVFISVPIFLFYLLFFYFVSLHPSFYPCPKRFLIYPSIHLSTKIFLVYLLYKFLFVFPSSLLYFYLYYLSNLPRACLECLSVSIFASLLSIIHLYPLLQSTLLYKSSPTSSYYHSLSKPSNSSLLSLLL